MAGNRPPRSSAGARPPTSSAGPAARPMTGRARNASRAGLSTAASNRPGTRAGGGMMTADSYGDDSRAPDEEWDEEDYESDDEDVFAFVPPDLGPAPQVVASSDPRPFSDEFQRQQRGQQQQEPQQQATQQQQHQQHQQQPPQQQATQSSAPPPAEEETFYFDEATGAVYDAEGRLVQMPQGFDPAPLSVPPAAASSPVHASSSLSRQNSESIRPPAPAVVYPPRISIDRHSSNSSSYIDMSGVPTPLQHANSFNQQKSPSTHVHMDALDEVEHLASRDGPNGRSVGFSANGSPMLDNSNTVRQRVNRMSHGADGPNSPNSHLNKLDYMAASAAHRTASPTAAQTGTLAGEDEFDDYDEYPSSFYNNYSGNKLARYSSELGQGMGLAHGIDYDASPQVGTRGIKMVELEMEGDEDSPYPEVRASVSNVDDTEMSANTLRMWILAFIFTTLGAAINQVLTLRYPAPALTALIIQVAAYPVGKLMAATLPITEFTMPKWLGGSTWSLNPGMFNIKEHTAIVMMGNAAITPAYALNTVLIQDSPYYYNDPKPLGFAILLTLSSQLLGFGLAGYGRRFLVTPGSMIWPQVLVFSTVFNTLHAEEDSLDGSMSRFKYFIIVSLGAFFWWWFPGWIFTALSTFSWLCWIWPNSFAVNTLFGTATGMGMSFITFDWQLITYNTSPLVTPWWAQCNIFAGFVFFLWIVAPILYWTNTYNFGYLPFSSSSSYDRFGNVYDVREILNPDASLNEAAYESYSQLYFGTTYYIVYWTGFAAFTSVLVHTILYHGRIIWRGVRGVKTQEDDVHAKLMHKYRHAPDWWYLIVFAIAVILAIINAEVYDTGLPVWGVLLCVVIPVVYYLPSGFIYAQTGASIGVNLISELVAGYALPSKSLPNMMIKLYSQVGLSQAFVFSQDLKLGHYMKISPRVTFAVMIVGAVWSALVQVFANLFMRKHVPGICSAEQEHQFTCPQAGVYFTSSIIWGVIGPQRLFSNGSYYSSVYWAQLAGVLAPIPVFILARRWPNSFLKVVNVPLIFTATSSIPPAGGIVVSAWFLTGFIFQYVLRKRNFRWWSKYNFVTSAAMDAGTILSGIMVFLTLTLPKDGSLTLNWWGNTVNSNTLDGRPMPRFTTPADGFAPAPQVIHAM